MKKNPGFVILILILMMGCMPVNIESTRPPDNIRVSETPTQISSELSLPSTSSSVPISTITPKTPTKVAVQPTVTVSPTETTTASKPIIEFPAPLPGSSVTQQCLISIDALPEGEIPTGTLTLDTRSLSPLGNEGDTLLMDFQTQATQVMPKLNGDFEATPSIYNISPNRKYFFYFSPSAANGGSKLHISTLDGQEQQVAYWDDTWGKYVRWLDDQHLEIIPPEKEGFDYGTVIILDPFSGNWQKFLPDYASGLNSRTLLIAYNRDLTKAVYLSGNYYILWDAQSHKDIWRKRGANYSFLLGGWSPDNNLYAMVILQENDGGAKVIHNDIFLVNPYGEEKQLTNFALAYPSMSYYIEAVAWSPNGKYLAISLYLDDGIHQVKGPSLVVVDLVNNRITEYCILVSERAGSLVWSPDSDQLAVTSPVDYEEYLQTAHKDVRQHMRVILVYIQGGYTIQIANDAASIGWMVKP